MTLRTLSFTIAATVALFLAGCLTPAENVAVNVVLPMLLEGGKAEDNKPPASTAPENAAP